MLDARRPDRWYDNGLALDAPATVLRRPTLHDVDAVLAIFSAASDGVRAPGWRPMRSRGEARELLGLLVGGWAHDCPTWFVDDRASGTTVGAVLASCDGAEVDLSYLVSPAWTGRGHASTAVRLIADAALAAPGVQRVVSWCDPHNPAAERALTKAGFTRKGARRGAGRRFVRER